MPNVGKQSRACHLCRKRRVQCDFATPGCVRCKKIDKQCPGYRTEQELRFHNQDIDSFMLKSARPCQKKRMVVTVGSEANSESSISRTDKKFPFSEHVFSGASRAQLAANTNSPEMPLQLAEHWQVHSIPIVLEKYFAPLSDSLPGSPNFYPELYKETGTENCCLRLATMAIAKAHLSHLACGLHNDKESVQIYGRALRATSYSVQDPTERKKDSTLLAVWLLGRFELFVNSPNKPPMPTPAAYNTHCRGLASLLHSRGQHQFSTKRGRSLFFMVYQYTLINHLTGNTEGPPQSDVWLSAIRPHLTPEEQPNLSLCNFLYRVTQLYPQIINLYMASPKATSNDEKAQRKLFKEITAVLANVETLRSDIHTWRTESAFQSLSTMYPATILDSVQLKLQFLVSLLINYVASSETLAPLTRRLDLPVLHQQCYSRIHFHSLVILSHVSPAFRDQTPSLPVSENSNCDGACWVDGMQLLFPIMVVCRVPAVSKEQREKAVRILRRIGTTMGIRFALNYTENYESIMAKPLKPQIVNYL